MTYEAKASSLVVVIAVFLPFVKIAIESSHKGGMRVKEKFGVRFGDTATGSRPIRLERRSKV